MVMGGPSADEPRAEVRATSERFPPASQLVAETDCGMMVRTGVSSMPRQRCHTPTPRRIQAGAPARSHRRLAAPRAGPRPTWHQPLRGSSRDCRGRAASSLACYSGVVRARTILERTTRHRLRPLRATPWHDRRRVWPAACCATDRPMLSGSAGSRSGAVARVAVQCAQPRGPIHPVESAVAARPSRLLCSR